MAEIEELQVDRIDGVKDPATRRRFLILKSEEPDELRENVRDLLEKVERALSLLAKSEVALDEETATALNEIAKALEIELVFEAKKKPGTKYGYPPEEYGYPEEEKPKPAKKDVDLAELIEARFNELREAIESLRTPAPATIAKSRQVVGQDALDGSKEFGKGLFKNIVFGG